MSNIKKTKKITRSYTLSPKAVSLLDQLHAESGWSKTEIVNKLIVDYYDSLKKKICV